MHPHAETELQGIAASATGSINWQHNNRLLLNPKRFSAGYFLHHIILHAQAQPEEFLQDVNVRLSLNDIIDEVSTLPRPGPWPMPSLDPRIILHT